MTKISCRNTAAEAHRVLTMTPTLKEITSYIHKNIPITAHLGVQVTGYDGKSVTLSAPLKPNLNHRMTAFGGSLSAVAILSGWALLHLLLKDKGLRCRLVIQKSSFEFSEPIDEDFEAVCSLPSDEHVEKFLRTLERHKRARISIPSKISSASGKGGIHDGSYVAVILNEKENV